MIKLNSDIFVFERIIPKLLIDKLVQARNSSGHTNRIDLNQIDMNLFREFDKFWLNEIESKMLEDYFGIYDIKSGLGYNVSEKTINDLKEYVQSRWRDMFLLNYSTYNSGNSEKNVHWDFSGITTVGCLSTGFTGGSLVFPRQGISHRIDIGDVIVFPGGITHPHYVTNITDGIRDVIVGQSMTLKQDHWIEY
jgi:hypothetical protein